MSKRLFSFSVQPRDGYCVVAFPKEIGKTGMADLSSATSDAIKELALIKSAACVVDLSALDYMESSLVACVVRIWKAMKAHSGTFVVVAPSEGIRDVLNVTGLQKIWTIVDTLEAGIHTLGFSVEAKVAKRERRLLILVGPIALICGAVAVAFRLVPQLAALAGEANWLVYWLVYSIAGLSIVASGISSIRENGWRRLFSIIVLVLAVALLGSYFALIKPTISEEKHSDSEKSKASTGSTASDASDDLNNDDVRSTEGKSPDIKSPDIKSPDIKSPDIKFPDIKSPDIKSTDAKSEDAKVEDAKVENPKVEEPKSENPKGEDAKIDDVRKLLFIRQPTAPGFKAPDLEFTSV